MSQYVSFLEKDALAFAEGTSLRCYRALGAHVLDDGVFFAVWVPCAKNVRVVGDFNGWGDTHEMLQMGSTGVWTLFIKGLGEYQPYKYRIISSDNQVWHKSDPFAFFCEAGPGMPSVTYRLEGFEWSEGDGEWMSLRAHEAYCEMEGGLIDRGQLSPVNIYEVHAGSWKRHEDQSFYTYRDLAQELVPYVRDLGYTHIQLRPVMEHVMDEDLGCRIVSYYSIGSRLGTPHDFMFFVDACHQAGVGVILDWVPGCFFRDEFGLSRFNGDVLFEIEQDNDDSGLQFDFSRGHVWSFLISNALYYFDVFHIDGLRVDVTHVLYKEREFYPGNDMERDLRQDDPELRLGFDSEVIPDLEKTLDLKLEAHAELRSEAGGDRHVAAGHYAGERHYAAAGLYTEEEFYAREEMDEETGDKMMDDEITDDAVDGLDDHQNEGFRSRWSINDSDEEEGFDFEKSGLDESFILDGEDDSAGADAVWEVDRLPPQEIDLGGLDFIRALTLVIRKRYPGVLLLAEDKGGWQNMTLPVEDDGLGFDFKLDLGWRRDLLRYAATDFSWRASHHRLVSFSSLYLFEENSVLPFSPEFAAQGEASLLERQVGDYGQKFAGLRALYCYYLAHPGKKSAFMGTELAQFVPWSLDEGLEWYLTEYETHRQFRDFVQSANQFYQAQTALWALDMSWDGFSWIDADNAKQGVLCFVRKARRFDDLLVVVLNMSPASYDRFRIGVPPVYEEDCWMIASPRSQQRFFEAVFNSDDLDFGGAGKVSEQKFFVDHIPWNHCAESVVLDLPALSGIFLRPGRL